MAKPARVVILGAGFAGAYCAQTLEPLVRAGRADVLLLDRHNFFAFFPLLVEAGTGSLEPRHAGVPIRSFIRRGTFREAEVLGVDVEGRRVRYRLVGGNRDEEAAYDHLVVALGSVARVPPVPGLAEFAFQVKSLPDAVELRDHAIHMLELADATTDEAVRRAALSIVVAGANFTGVEVAGEFQALMIRAAGRLYRNVPRAQVRVTLVELGDRILHAVSPSLAEYATRHMERRGIRVLVKASVVRVTRDEVELSSGERVPTRTVIWAAGIAPPPLLKGMGLPLDERGYLVCEPDGRVKGCADVWGIGDAAANPGPDGKAYPATAQHAVREGRHVAGNIGRVLEGKGTEPMTYRTMGTTAAIGCRSAVAEVMGVKVSGFPAWFLWRTLYLLKMPGVARRARLAADWTLDLLFRRELVQLGIHRGARGPG